MNINSMPKPAPANDVAPIRIAVLAMGGQGGGVLVDWIVALAEAQNWYAQSTSVPGVAQRTGATIYYIEMLPLPTESPEARPVLALMPAPGEVDIVISAELMEAGRAIQRGLVTAGLTTLITSSHRSFAVQEKEVPGDGIGEAAKVYDAATAHSRRFLAFDMQSLSEETGSMISAVLFGALAASGALPFAREHYEAQVKASDKGASASLRAFAAGFARAEAEAASPAPPMPPAKPQDLKLFPALAPMGHPGFDALVARAASAFPAELHGMLAAGLRATVDFQDVAYGAEYLDHVSNILALDQPERGHRLTMAAAKHSAVAMAYDDVVRVADRKIRASRFERIRQEVTVQTDQVLYTTEFMHPRMDEVCGTLPAGLGRWIEARPRVFKTLDRFVNKGRRVRTGTIRWFLVLYGVAALKPFRRGSLRHQRETAHMAGWLARAKTAANTDYDLAVELLENRRLIKGYSDTHQRGASKFDIVMGMGERLAGRQDAAEWVRRLRHAALLDEEGKALAEAVKTVESFL
jgi:indolepyruvate ferredoxin oxidoreductase, beta subunit